MKPWYLTLLLNIDIITFSNDSPKRFSAHISITSFITTIPCLSTATFYDLFIKTRKTCYYLEKTETSKPILNSRKILVTTVKRQLTYKVIKWSKMFLKLALGTEMWLILTFIIKYSKYYFTISNFAYNKTETKGGSRYKVYHYEERVIFFIRHLLIDLLSIAMP